MYASFNLAHFNYIFFNEHCACRGINKKSSKLWNQFPLHVPQLHQSISRLSSREFRLFELIADRVCVSRHMVLGMSLMISNKLEISRGDIVIFKMKTQFELFYFCDIYLLICIFSHNMVRHIRSIKQNVHFFFSGHHYYLFYFRVITFLPKNAGC